MKNISICLFLFSLFLITDCECGKSTSKSIPDDDNNQHDTILGITGYGIDPTKPYSETKLHVYYLSGTGSDTTGDGSSSSPWRQLSKVQEVMVSGDTIILRDGTYNKFQEGLNVARTDWITIKADSGASPVILGMWINYTSARSDMYLRFDGIEFQIEPDDAFGISIQNGNYFELRNCTIHQQYDNKYTVDTAVRFVDCDNVLIYRNNIYNVLRGINTQATNNATIYGNHIHHLGGSTGFGYNTDCSNVIFEKNNVHDSNHNSSDPDAPDDPHGSGISIRSNDIWIKENIFHDLGSSSGIMFYQEGAQGGGGGESVYKNIIIENNLLYDIHNYFVLRIYYLGNNIIIRNNTMIGKIRDDSDFWPTELWNAMSVHTIAEGYDGSGLAVYNNIFAGKVGLPQNANIKNNIMWSFVHNDISSIEYLEALEGNIILTNDGDNYPIDYFITNFFNGIHSESDFADKHGMTLDFTLAPDSDAKNYGDPADQPTESLGTIDANGFIQNDGVIRDTEHHSAGCYE